MVKHEHKVKRRPLHHNLKFSMVLLLIPILGAVFIVWYLFSDSYVRFASSIGTERLITDGWEELDSAFQNHIPDHERKFAYYQVKEKQTLADVAEHFSVPEEELARLNPGEVAVGTTVKVPPLQAPMKQIQPNGTLATAQVFEENGILYVANDYKFEQIKTTLPELADFLAPYGVFSKIGPNAWRLERQLILQQNIRLDIVSPAVKRLELHSAPKQQITCLCLENADLLIQGVTVTSYDPTTKQPDKNYDDGRSFIRALKSSRMDVLNSDISYLGNELQDTEKKAEIQKNGGTYGISWRIPDGSLGSDIATGWVQGNDFHHNHFGSYTFGASGMVWKDNVFRDNDVYGLDPHDDSNNALIEGNVFENNGKHGFIVSKRCNYNVIRNNISRNNLSHGFMLHQNSVYNLIENNVASGNMDNYAIYQSDNNMIRNNRSLGAKNSHVRINAGSVNTYVIGNTFEGGNRGVYAYGGNRNVYVANNQFKNLGAEILRVSHSQTTMFVNNTISRLDYDVDPDSRVIYGPNSIAQ